MPNSGKTLDEIKRVSKLDADIVLSGLLAHDVPGVVSAYGQQGWHLQKRIDLEGWAALLLHRVAGHPLTRF